MYKDMLSYVNETLNKNNAQYCTKINQFPFRKRIDHISRVFMWAKRLLNKETANEKIVLTAAIFHDVGYAKSNNPDEHSFYSSLICKDYLSNNGFDNQFINKVTNVILNHSKKELLNRKDIDFELILLMEADLLDETGALSIVWDCMMEGSEDEQSFIKTYNHIKEYSSDIINENPMVSETAKNIWEEKQKLTKSFINSLEYDLGIEE